VDEFVALHPEQHSLMQTFSQIVAQPGVKQGEIHKKRIKIAVIYPDIQVSDYWRRSLHSFIERLDEIGINHSVTEYSSKTSNEYKAQFGQVQNALEDDPDYLILTFDIFRHKTLVERLLKRKRPKIILQNILTPLRDWEGFQPFMYVAFDHTIGARLLADYFTMRTGGKGTYGLLYFPTGYVNTMRSDTFRNLMERTSIKLVKSAHTDSTVADAAKAAREILSHQTVDFIYATSTDIALGAIKAIKQRHQSGKVLINGWGGGSAELKALMKGDLDVTIMRMNDDNGVAMAEGIRLDQEGRGDTVPTIYSGEMVLIEKGIAPHDLEMLIKRAFRYSGKPSLDIPIHDHKVTK